jgi:tRNA(Phe) wybutosine-synthesizing methylase Tyw3
MDIRQHSTQVERRMLGRTFYLLRRFLLHFHCARQNCKMEGIAKTLLNMAISVGFRLTRNRGIREYEKRRESVDLCCTTSERHLRCGGLC